MSEYQIKEFLFKEFELSYLRKNKTPPMSFDEFSKDEDVEWMVEAFKKATKNEDKYILSEYK